MIGKQLGDYRVLEPLGRALAIGGGSDRFLAVRGDGTQVVVEAFGDDLWRDQGRLQTLRDSLRLAAALRHPNIVPIQGSGIHQGRPFILLPYYQAGDLEDRWESGVVMALDTWEILKQLASAMDYAHTQGVVHGGLTPGHVWFDESGIPAITGFGQSSLRHAQASTQGSANAQGGYLAPEILAGNPPGPSADRYSLAVIALELLTRSRGREAWTALSAPSAPAPGGRRDRPARPSDGRPAMPPAAREVLLRALNSNPRTRFASASELNRALRIALTLEAAPKPAVVTAPEPRPQPRRRRRAAFAPFVVLGLLILVGVPALAGGKLWLRLLPPTAAPGLSAAQLAATTAVPTSDPNASATPSTLSGAILALGTPTATRTTLSSGAPAPTSAPPKPPQPTATTKPTGPGRCKDTPGHPNYCTPVP
jgi:serine/threonine protein kinase